MVTKAAERFFQHPTPGVKKSLFFPPKKVVQGVIQHNSLDSLVAGNKNNNLFAVEKEYGKYDSLKSKGKTQRLIEGTFGSPHQGLENRGTFFQRVKNKFFK